MTGKGAAFMDGMPRLSCYRDKDIPALIAGGMFGRTVGLIGSDIAAEQAPDFNNTLRLEPLVAIEGLRFALASRSDKASATADKLQAGEPVVVGTSYPRVTRAIAQRWQLPLQVGAIVGGQVERLASDLPDQLDGVIDLVRTGGSVRQHSLRIVADQLLRVTLCAIWSNQDFTEGKSTAYGV